MLNGQDERPIGIEAAFDLFCRLAVIAVGDVLKSALDLRAFPKWERMKRFDRNVGSQELPPVSNLVDRAENLAGDIRREIAFLDGGRLFARAPDFLALRRRSCPGIPAFLRHLSR